MEDGGEGPIPLGRDAVPSEDFQAAQAPVSRLVDVDVVVAAQRVGRDGGIQVHPGQFTQDSVPKVVEILGTGHLSNE